MLDKILSFIADKLNWGGFDYNWNVGTNNTSDTWFPVFKNNNIQHAVVADYVTESGTNGNWKYRKWKSGRYDAYYRGTINLAAGTAWQGGYYHAATSTAPPPSFSKSVTFFKGTPQSAVLCWCVGYGANYQSYWVNAASGTINNLQVLLEIEGTWK